jgi:hypothetical protein
VAFALSFKIRKRLHLILPIHQLLQHHIYTSR